MGRTLAGRSPSCNLCLEPQREHLDDREFLKRVRAIGLRLELQLGVRISARQQRCEIMAILPLLPDGRQPLP